ncbi:ATP-binding cassette domain-containing protein [Emticicia sp. CRIBPO]|uniref:peptidase domain-containing ABC transporter n=1 Tax=Emticicia sp. CRIBPO TaxID=2683258 RepID=UPI00141242B1|nr:ATP-binding cassette domain-containing protein [Emticicia sp. CRIBPO]NBA86053.1 ATP-binding cassette domain-containing protein [Emticicia sp. CRIBPO]
MKNETYSFEKLVKLIRLERSEITVIYFYAIFSGLIQLSLPLGIQAILGFVLGATMVTSVYLLIFIIIAAVFVVGYLRINKMKIIEKIQQKIFVRFAFEFAEKIPKLDLKATDQYYLPEKINRFFDTLNVQKGISKLLLDIPGASIQIFFGLILLSLYHPFFIVFSVVLVALLWVIFNITSIKGLKTSISESNYKYEVVAWLEELGRVIKSFKYSQGSHLNLIKADEKVLNYINARTSHFQVLLFQFKTLIFFKVSITALMLILGTYLLFSQKINIGQFVAAEIVILSIIGAIEKLIASLDNVYDVVTGLYKIDSVVELPSEKGGEFELRTSELSIELKNVHFSYQENRKIFENISVLIPARGITCISGEESSGKSTFLKLLTGSYMDFKGEINFNGIPLQNYSLESLRSRMGILLFGQDLFEGTLYENITLGRSEIVIDRILDLSRRLGIENFISFFPSSFETRIDPLGRKLPSSLVKKILLLRALIHDPVLLVLEEPWMGFDEGIEQNIKNYLSAISSSRTIVISTNDQSFIEKCTANFHISNGTILKK